MEKNYTLQALQCDQMATLFDQYFAKSNNENLVL